MISLISPAKTLDFDTKSRVTKFSIPDFLTDSEQLMDQLKKCSAAQICELMSISQNLGELNHQRFQSWNPEFDLKNAKQAIFAFKGEVYLGLQAENFENKDLNFAQKNLRILSGLYGLLKPLDLIKPYRLEMGTKFLNHKGKDLYVFWDKKLSQKVEVELENHADKTLVNLASNEYFKAIKSKLFAHKIITPIFKDFKNNEYKMIGFFAKKARGMMAAFIVKNKIEQPKQIKDFDSEGYVFNPKLSTESEWVFTRN
ncbi:MAG: peroxide stress protein YaaA [Bacteroidetes bacterium]|nr:MAG: peroxide stress protein YaaA [Bacteroidota bacterium]